MTQRYSDFVLWVTFDVMHIKMARKLKSKAYQGRCVLGRVAESPAVPGSEADPRSAREAHVTTVFSSSLKVAV